MAESKRYSKRDYIRGLLVLETVFEMTSNLDAGNIPNSVKAELLEQATPVNIGVTVTAIKPNIYWQIQNGAKKLLIYKDKEMGVRPTFRIYKEDFTLENDLLPGTEIVGTCFYRESLLGENGDPYKRIFPSSMNGVIFKRCNLDNVYVPPGNILAEDGGIPCSHRRIRVQNDLEDWIVDATGKAVEPLDLKRFRKLGLSVDPKDIPTSAMEVSP